MRSKKNRSCIPGILLRIWEEAKPGVGEDCVMHGCSSSGTVLGVFDGCGGAGAQRHSCYTDHTEAYMASRLAAGAFYDSFQDLFPTAEDPETARQAYLTRTRERLDATLDAYQPPKQSGGGVKGSIVRVLPSTAAVLLIQPAEEQLQITAIWAGDSRCYLLDGTGLAQLTRDDTTVPDPMENLYEDGILRNVLHAGGHSRLHTAVVTAKPPFAALCATDGCFGYFSTPMEFEGALLGTLLEAANPADWEQRLSRTLGAVAGDDYTLCLGGYGFPDFKSMQDCYRPRFRQLTADCLDRLRGLPLSEREPRRALWQRYRETYLRYLKEE